MTKAEMFKQAIEKLESDSRYITIEQDVNYMGNMNNWCIVHATKYMPRENVNGTMYIPSTAMATGFDIPRSTIHTTLNHVVASHGGGSWDDTPIVVLASFNDAIKQNGNPAEVSGTDTYWSVNPDTGFVLPKSAYIIRPDDNGPLYQIGEHSATYKRDNYTDEEVAKIESMLDMTQKAEYNKYTNGDLTTWEIDSELMEDKRIKQMYDGAKDKKAFLRGLFEESRFAILSKYLRDAVVKLSMDKIGFRYIDTVYDSNITSSKIADVAQDANIPATANDKGHFNSVYNAIENYWVRATGVLNYGPGGLLNQKDLKSVYDTITNIGIRDSLGMAIIQNIVANKPIDFEKIYQDEYIEIINSKIFSAESNVMNWQEEKDRFTNDFPDMDENTREQEISRYETYINENNKIIKDLSVKKTITDYDKNLGKTIRRHCERLTAQYNAWRNELVKQSEFLNLVQKLQTLIASHNLQHSGRDRF